MEINVILWVQYVKHVVKNATRVTPPHADPERDSLLRLFTSWSGDWQLAPEARFEYEFEIDLCSTTNAIPAMGHNSETGPYYVPQNRSLLTLPGSLLFGPQERPWDPCCGPHHSPWFPALCVPLHSPWFPYVVCNTVPGPLLWTTAQSLVPCCEPQHSPWFPAVDNSTPQSRFPTMDLSTVQSCLTNLLSRHVEQIPIYHIFNSFIIFHSMISWFLPFKSLHLLSRTVKN